AIPIGYLVDHRNRKWILAAGLWMWSLATILCGTAKGFMGLFAARVGVGVGEASVSPAASSLIADYFPPEKRAKAYGIFMLGSTLGTGMAYLVGALALQMTERIHALDVPWLAEFKSWQLVFFIIGAPGLLLALLLLATVREPVRREKLVRSSSFTMAPIITILKANRISYFTVIGGTVFNLICVYAQLAWLPTLFIRSHGWAADEVSVAFGVVVLPIGVFSAFSAGWLMNWLSDRGQSDAPLTVMKLHAIFLAIFGSLTCLSSTSTLAYVGFMFVTIPAAWSYAAALAALNQITPNELRGQITGVYTLVTGLVSMGVGAFAVGLLSDKIFPSATGIAPSLATVNLISSIVSILILVAGAGAFRRAADNAKAWLERAGVGA
ncbi:MAG: MFS transporter, partial [Rhodospirillaceae bacterium]|nr:MFS transporter [Rhodospirillaceae bacterium]